MTSSSQDKPTEDEKRKQEEDRLRIAYSRVFDSPDGELVLGDLMREVGFMNRGYDPDPHRTNYCQGQRSVFSYIEQRCQIQRTWTFLKEKPERQEEANDE